MLLCVCVCVCVAVCVCVRLLVHDDCMQLHAAHAHMHTCDVQAKERRGVAHLVSPIKLFSDLPKQAITVLGAAYGHPTDGGKR